MGAAVIFLTSYPYTVWTRVSCQAVSPTNGLGTRLYSSQPEPLPWTASCLISELRPSANSVNFHPVLQQLNSCHLTYYNQHAVWKLFDQKEKSDYSYLFILQPNTAHKKNIWRSYSQTDTGSSEGQPSCKTAETYYHQEAPPEQRKATIKTRLCVSKAYWQIWPHETYKWS